MKKILKHRIRSDHIGHLVNVVTYFVLYGPNMVQVPVLAIAKAGLKSNKIEMQKGLRMLKWLCYYIMS